MQELIQAVLNSDEKTAWRQLVSALGASGKRYFLRNEILYAFADYCQQTEKPPYFYHTSALGKLVHYTHEIILEEGSTWLLIRPWIASQEMWRLSTDLSHVEQVPPRTLLDVRDRQVNRFQRSILEIDLQPFYKNTPTITDPRNIGQGLAFLNRYLCSQVLTNPKYWLEVLFDVLHRHQYDGMPLMISDRITSGKELARLVKQAIHLVGERPPLEPFEKFRFDLQALGFEPGWGNTAIRVRESLELLDRLIDNPESALLEAFVSRVPAVFRVVSVAVHGWVAQAGVVGRDETAGQVMYVLEQARSLENRLRQDIELAGLTVLGIQPQVIVLTRLIPQSDGTTCDQRLEKIDGTENAWILRVPFQDFNPKVTQHWISKGEIWPYLESFALDAETELLAQFRGSPNLILGNYSDGSLVAFLLARRLGVTQCNIAHTLEKPRHLFSDLYWQDLEPQYHFSAQFTADLINMNAADFIIASSYQEIVGTPDTFGQYESYKCFTMPQLYHVVDGVDLFSSKFNVVPPGVNETIFFPYDQQTDRDANIQAQVEDLLFTREDAQIFGYLTDPSKRPLFACAIIDPVKNLTGLVECFGQSQELRDRCNLILLTNKLQVDTAATTEEAQELEKLHQLIDQYQLQGQIRWIGPRLPRLELSEAYRVIADRQGIFVHFARFEAFGRTILEAMLSGLPTFATQFGGPAEIIQDGENGFHINPTDRTTTTKQLLDFIDRCSADPTHWQTISKRAIERVHNQYTWTLHTHQLLLLTKLYSFWNFVNRDTRETLLRYVETLFHLVYKPRAAEILEHHNRQ